MKTVEEILALLRQVNGSMLKFKRALVHKGAWTPEEWYDNWPVFGSRLNEAVRRFEMGLQKIPGIEKPAKERDVALVVEVVASLLEAHRVDATSLYSLVDTANYTPPEHHIDIWRALCSRLGELARSGAIPDPAAPDCPRWGKWLSDLVEGRIVLDRRKEIR